MKKLLLLFAAIVMASTGLWAETVSYLYPVYNTDGVPTSGIKEWQTTSANATVVTNSGYNVTWGTTGTTTWYVVTGADVVLSEGVFCKGDVRLILADGAKLTATGGDYYPGIKVSGDGNSLIIYGQTAQSGQLIANGGQSAAGIGGGDDGSGSNITINGGTVTAKGGFYGAGIGGGVDGHGANITINGGTVTAAGGYEGAGIGGGSQGDGTNITINGGMVMANGGYGAAGIGGAASSNIFVATTRMVKAGSSENPSTPVAHTGDDDLASVLTGKQYVMVTPPVYYIDEYGEEQAANSASEITSSTDQVTLGTAGKTTWYVVTGADVTLSKGAICQGDVRLILADGAKLTATGGDYEAGIQVSGEGNSLTIYGQTAQSGQLEATGGTFCAGIGGRDEQSGSNITINGGTVTATGDEGGAGIGGGYEQSGSNITINGGTVTANGGSMSAGIGGGESGNGSNISINGGTVTANGGSMSAGIGGGESGNGSNISINGGTVTATGGWDGDGAGIGGGKGGNGSNITINGGTVTAKGGDCGAGIGGGEKGNGYNITINGGTVTAKGGDYGAGIGGGEKGNGYNITINGGVITAISTSTYKAPAIGGGYQSSDNSNINITIATSLCVKAGSSENPTTEIATNRTDDTDLATELADERYVTIELHKHAVVYGEHVTVSPNFTSGTEIAYGTQVTFTAADRSEDGHPFLGFYKESTFDTPITTGVSGRTYTVTMTDADISVYARYDEYSHQYVSYIDEQGVSHDTDAYVVTDATDTYVNWGVAGRTTWYVVQGTDVQLPKGAICQGDVQLILADGATLTATGDNTNSIPCIQVSGEGNSLTIYGQTKQTGKIIADGVDSSAGIGGGYQGSGSNITINGGIVTATGGSGAAGIGGGAGRSGSNITINGGTVTANGGSGAAGIGGGGYGSGSNITINGGTVTANGGVYGAGIGGGDSGNGSNITINGGTVTANGGVCGAGIGGGDSGNGSNITINGGIVTATGNGGAGIGGGYGGDDASNIFVATILDVKADGNNPPTTVIENTGADLAGSLAGKRYVTVSDAVCNLTANQDPDHIKNYYSTFYSGTKAYALPDGVTAYTGVTDGSVLTLTPVANGIIPAGEAVILRLTTDDNTAMTQKIQLTATTTTATKSTDNMLQGSDEPMTLPDNSYALSLGQKGVGFYKFDNVELPAHKAYLTYASGSAISLRFSFGDATDIDTIETEAPAKAYNLQGQQVDESYKGIVIKNGKKMLNN